MKQQIKCLNQVYNFLKSLYKSTKEKVNKKTKEQKDTKEKILRNKRIKKYKRQIHKIKKHKN